MIGNERMRRPVAWYTALAMAADTPTVLISPRPLMPRGLTVSDLPTKTTSNSGVRPKHPGQFWPGTNNPNRLIRLGSYESEREVEAAREVERGRSG